NTIVEKGPMAPPSPGFRNAPPCSLYYAEKKAEGMPPLGGGYPDVLPWAHCGLTPPELRAAYGITDAVARGDDGHGVRVGIVDAYASPTIFADAHEYSVRNDPAHVLQPSQFSEINLPGVCQNRHICDARGWYGEETLDVEAVHAM